MYLDTVTDGCLRGLGQQTRCMAINVLDATLGVVLVWVLLPRFGLAGYIFILYFNECVNFHTQLHLAAAHGAPHLRR